MLKVLENAGAEVDETVYRKHVKIKWRYRGVKKTTVVPSTTSDHRAILNNVALARRQLRECEDG